MQSKAEMKLENDFKIFRDKLTQLVTDSARLCEIADYEIEDPKVYTALLAIYFMLEEANRQVDSTLLKGLI